MRIAGSARINDSLQLGYGDNYRTIELVGTSLGSYAGNTAGAAIYSTATDRALINIQGGRLCRIAGLYIVGQNRF